ncbi:MAG: phosphoenolpyruvate--protein phosphotransferase [Clostridium sp.]|uniref:phosphoenolpyruvate--protein phosphotransferase n=1 Tax=Clostridium sp. TaxID=1506 RepID=UPI00306ECF14
MKKGIQASTGYALGEVFVKQEENFSFEEKKIEKIEDEKNRLREAVEVSRMQLNRIKEKSERELGHHRCEIFESHLMLLDDPEFIGAVDSGIETNKVNAEKALEDVVVMYTDIFEAMDDEYMKSRGIDIKDVGQRILQNLLGKKSYNIGNIKENTVIIAHDLTPSDTAQLDKNKVVAFLTDIGGRTSHSAIMARILGIPAVVGLGDITHSVKNGDKIIVDGVKGMVIINPDEETIRVYEEKNQDFEKEKNELKKLINVKAVTKSGKQIKLCGNIGQPEEVHQVLENGGEGIGLFRTEFLYMDRGDMPSEEEQFEAYKYVAEKMEEKPVVIRTLDIGGDKNLVSLPMTKEENPFLGYRAIRICLDRVDIFKVQLRAVLRASAFGNIKVMFPMISSLNEFLDAKGILQECMEELRGEGKKFNEGLEVGIMVEIPAAAVMADEFAKYVDFFSIGTNDLIQYTLAADRMNEKISYMYNPMHPAVLKLIKITIEAAHNEGKWCGMCGEMAGDETAIPTLLEYGLNEFSMSPYSISGAKKIIVNW